MAEVVGQPCDIGAGPGAWVDSNGEMICKTGVIPTVVENQDPAPAPAQPDGEAPDVAIAPAPVDPDAPVDPAAPTADTPDDPQKKGQGLGKVEKSKKRNVTFLADHAPIYSMNEHLLMKFLESKGLNPDEQALFMRRFDGLDPTVKEKRVKAYLTNEEFKKKSGDELREDNAKWARDQGVKKGIAGDVSPLDIYNNEVAKGIVVDDPEVRASLVGKDWKHVDPKKWEVVPVKGDVAKQIAADPLIVSRDFKADSEEVRADTQRRILLTQAEDKFVAYHTTHGNPPLTIEEAKKHFHKIAVNLEMINPDGTVRNDWDPNAPAPADSKDPVPPARAFFPKGEIFEADGITLKKGVEFNHGDLGQDVDASHPEKLDAATRADLAPDSPQLVADFRKKLIDEEGYSPAEADFIIDNLDPKGGKLTDLSPAEAKGYMDGFLSSPKESRDTLILAQGQNKLAKDYAEKMGVSEAVARELLAMKGPLRRSATMEQVGGEQKRIDGLNVPPLGMSLEAARKDSQYKDWAAERDALYEATGAHRGDRDGNRAKRNKIKQNLDPADLQYQDQLGMLDKQTQKQLKLKQIDQGNALELERVRQDNAMEQLEERHKNDKELEDVKHRNTMEVEDLRQKYENARSFVKMAADFISALLNTLGTAVGGDKQMLGQVTAASISKMQSA